MQKTILVLLDACGYAISAKHLGFFEHLIDYKQGAKYKVRGELPSLSKPMYATLLTGLPAYQHGAHCNEMKLHLSCESVFSLCKEHGGVTAAAAYEWMSELYNHAPFRRDADRIQLNSDENIMHGIYYWEDAYPDSHLIADGEYLRKTFDPDFLLYHTMAIDLAGHQAGAESTAYAHAVSDIGNRLAMVLPDWLAQGYHVVVTGDHGMSEQGLHGGDEDIQRDVPLYIFSPKAEPGRFEETYVSQLNVAPLLCHLLGIAPADGMRQTLEIALKEKRACK